VRFKGTIAIIGAGIGGLALAGFLARRGVTLTLSSRRGNFAAWVPAFR
jgi:2-polyprenyl-6-methoxyphenol hydroxylase-like FAD-dependent oxidoreductase